MLWVCRAGRGSIFEDLFLEQERIFLVWPGFDMPMNPPKSKEEVRRFVSDEKGTTNRTSISNWSGQLEAFSYEMKVGDYVLIPSKHRSFTLARITGEYEYGIFPQSFHHSRKIKVLAKEIPKSIFSQSIIYTLGAYRTLFKIRDEKEVLTTIKHWIASLKQGVENG